MDTAQRMRLVRIIEKIDNNKDFSRRIGIKNVSTFKKPDRKKPQHKSRLLRQNCENGMKPSCFNVSRYRRQSEYDHNRQNPFSFQTQRTIT